MSLQCPHCQSSIDIEGDTPTDVVCPTCGSNFALEPGRTTAWLPTEAPRRLGKFEFLEHVGTGAFGAVYKARDTELDRIVALKIPRSGSIPKPIDMERFLREAKSAAQLKHSGIVSLYDAGPIDGTCCLVSEFIHGSTLAEYLSAKRFSVRQAAELVAEVADALHYAHQRGVIHRDMKPSNIMLDLEGRPHLMDFGLAKRAADEITMTLEGQVLGTPAYMSPEQARGEIGRVDERSDLYSLGVILYELLTGELPFRGQMRMLLVQVIQDEPRPPRRLNDAIPRDLETICLKAMAKEPARRYATARDLADDLRRFVNGEPIQARPVGQVERFRRWCRRNPLVAGLTGAVALLLLAVAAGSLFAVYRINESLVDTQLARDDATEFAKEADAERIKALKNLERSRQLLVQLNVDKGTRLLDEADPLGAMLWFTEALKWIGDDPGQTELHRLRLAAVRRDSPRLFHVETFDKDLPSAAFSPDGKRVAVALGRGPPKGQLFHFGEGEVRVFDPLTGHNAFPPIKLKGTVNHVAFSPDGKRIVTATGMMFFVSLKLDRGCEARVWDAVTGEPLSPPLKHINGVPFAGFTDDGRRVVTTSVDGTACLWDAATGAKIVEMPHADSPVMRARFSPDGRVLATMTIRHPTSKKGAPAIHLWDAVAGKPLTAPVMHPESLQNFFFSPDGRQIATIESGRQSGYKIRLWDVATGKPATLSHLSVGAVVLGIAYSPDGRYLASADSSPSVRIWELASGREMKRLEGTPSSFHHLQFSPDGQQLLVSGAEGWNRSGESRLWDVATGKPITSPLRHTYPVHEANFSPDGGWILTRSALSAGQNQGELRLWDVTPWRPRFVEPKKPAAASRRRITWKRTQVEVRDTETKTTLTQKPLQFELPVYHAGMSNDGRYAVVVETLEKDPLVYRASLWDLATEKRLGEPWKSSRNHYNGWRFMFSPDSRRLFSLADNRLRDTATGSVLGGPMNPSSLNQLGNAVFSPDGRLLVTCGAEGAQAWHTETGKPAFDGLLQHSQTVSNAIFDGDGSRVLTCSFDGTARLWRLSDGQPAGPALKHSEWVQGAAFSGDNRLVATYTGKEARVWEAATGLPLTPSLPHATLNSIAFADDGKKLSGEISLPLYRGNYLAGSLEWRQTPDTTALDELNVFVETMSGRRLDEVGGLTPLEPNRFQSAWVRLRDRYKPNALVSSPGETRDWHTTEMYSGVHQRQWFPVAFHAGRLLAEPTLAEPKLAGGSNTEALLQRGRAYAEMEQWDRAAADYLQAIRLLPPDAQLSYKHAMLRAALVQPDQYRQACAALLASFPPDIAPEIGDAVVWACVVVPRGVDDPSILVRRAEQTVKSDPTNPIYLRTLAAALLRAGQAEQANERLDEAMRVRDDFPSAWLLKALAQQQLGKTKEARQVLDCYDVWQKQQPAFGGWNQLSWDERLKLQLLRREVEDGMRDAK